MNFLDEPRLFKNDPWDGPIRGKFPVPDIEEYTNAFPNVLAVLYKDYNCEEYSIALKKTVNLEVDTYDRFISDNGSSFTAIGNSGSWMTFLKADGPVIMPISEELQVVDMELIVGISSLISTRREMFPAGVVLEKSSRPPYLFFYHYASVLRECGLQVFGKGLQRRLLVLLEFISNYTAPNFNEAKKLFSEGIVNSHHLSKLFRPDDIVITTQNGHPRAYVSTGWLQQESDYSPSLNCWSWEFDGNFYKEKVELFVKMSPSETPTPINDLNIYPLRLDQTGLAERLRSRGMQYWSCRDKRYVSYHGLDYFQDSMV